MVLKLFNGYQSFKSKSKCTSLLCKFCFNGLWLCAVFGCPAHDQRDFDFAKKYNLEIKTVVRPHDKDKTFEVSKKLIPDLVF